MKTRIAVMVAVGIFLSVAIGSCAVPQAGGLRPSDTQFSSQWVEIGMGGMMSIPGKGLSLALDLKNKGKQTVYVMVVFDTPDPSQRCEIAKQLDASQSALFSCPQNSLTPNADYPIEIEIYTDEGRSNLVENPTTKFLFSEKDVQAFNELSRALEAEGTK
jgi:hypothetical protein